MRNAAPRRTFCLQQKEAVMHSKLMLSIAGCALAGVMCSTAASADWRNPYVYRETSGTWTNVEYNDGLCHYYYSHNAYDDNTKLNKYGDCSQVVIGADGAAVPVSASPAVVIAPYGAAVPDDD
jgi:hypothetical protein